MRREQKAIEAADYVPEEHEIEKFIVHHPGLPITLPTPQEEMFAIVNIKGRQYKVMQDDIIVTEIQKDVDVNDQVIFDSVYLVGAKDYTLLGRPTIQDAKVWCTVEQITKGLKTIVLKKKRRKGYRRSMGFRARLITFRVDFIDPVAHLVASRSLERFRGRVLVFRIFLKVLFTSEEEDPFFRH